MISKEEIKKDFNEYFFGSDMAINFAEKIYKKYDVWFNNFNPPFEKINRIKQYYGQASFIRFGDMLEEMINKIINHYDFKNLEKTIESKDYDSEPKKKLKYDMHFQKSNDIYVVEIKMRDNHDSTKYIGQAKDFARKVYESKKHFKEGNTTGILFFIDNSNKKNGDKEKQRAKDESKKWGFKVNFELKYGIEFFEFLKIEDEQWNNFNLALSEWKKENEPLLEKAILGYKENMNVIRNYLKNKKDIELLSKINEILSLIDEYKI